MHLMQARNGCITSVHVKGLGWLPQWYACKRVGSNKALVCMEVAANQFSKMGVGGISGQTWHVQELDTAGRHGMVCWQSSCMQIWVRHTVGVLSERVPSFHFHTRCTSRAAGCTLWSTFCTIWACTCTVHLRMLHYRLQRHALMPCL
jgi:hypothetical protein